MTLTKGIFVISLDTELAWGTNGNPRFLRAYRDTRPIVDAMLKILEHYRLSATWAVVGELFAEPTEPNDIWHASDMIRRIMACPVPQEIGCHSFSHRTQRDSCNVQCFDRELERCTQVARTWNITLESFVYPRNAVKFPERLSAHGFRIFREQDDVWYGRLPGIFRRIGHAVDAYFWPRTTVGMPVRRGDVLAIPGNQYFVHRAGWAKLLPVSFRTRKAFHGLQRAARERNVFHFWTHPENIATDPRALLMGFRDVCARAAQLRDAGVLDNMTMGQLAHHYHD
jgi:hypothetical protein